MGAMFVAIVLVGGFFDWGVAAIGAIIVGEIVLFYRKEKPVYKKKRTIFTCIPLIFLILMLLSSLWAVDATMNLFGVIRGIVILLWMYLCFQMEETEGIRILDMIPYIGAVMVVIGIISQIHQSFSSLFWQARRFGGFFQYANTCALFLMLGVVILVQRMFQGKRRNKEKIKICFLLFLLITGIFLTGSRSIVLIFLVWGIYKAFTVKRLRLPIVIVTFLCVTVAYIYGMAAGDRQNIARIFTLGSTNSTILGRLLYYVDGLSMVKERPLGLGYMGYYYMQPAVQTGVYTTRFIHNDFLQVLVDYGIIACMMAVIYLVYQLIKGRQGKDKKELLVIILLASLVDFHMQYMSVFMIAVLCFDLGTKEKVRKRRDLRENYVFCVVAIVFFSYILIACLAFQMKKYELALQLIPGYTEAQTQYLGECADKEEAVLIADNILARNEYIAEAYHTKMYAALMDGDFDTALYCMDSTLAIRRYDVERYKMYDELLDEMILISEKEMPNEAERLRLYKNELPKRLAMLEKSTHPIAFELRDRPVFSW